MNKEEKLREAAEALIRSKAFPNGTTDQLWDNFKYEHLGTKWVGFAINAMVDFIKQYNHQQSEAGDTQTELAFKITELITNHTKSLTRKKDSIVIGQGEAAHHITNLVFPHLKQPAGSEWVSVEDMLPKPHEVVLLWNEAQIGAVVGYIDSLRKFHYSHTLHSVFSMDAQIKDVFPERVTFWKTLTPPTGKTNEG